MNTDEQAVKDCSDAILSANEAWENSARDHAAWVSIYAPCLQAIGVKLSTAPSGDPEDADIPSCPA